MQARGRDLNEMKARGAENSICVTSPKRLPECTYMMNPEREIVEVDRSWARRGRRRGCDRSTSLRLVARWHSHRLAVLTPNATRLPPYRLDLYRLRDPPRRLFVAFPPSLNSLRLGSLNPTPAHTRSVVRRQRDPPPTRHRLQRLDFRARLPTPPRGVCGPARSAPLSQRACCYPLGIASHHSPGARRSRECCAHSLRAPSGIR